MTLCTKNDTVIFCYRNPKKNEFQNTAATEGDTNDIGTLNAEYRNLAGNIDGELLRGLESMRGTMLGKRLSALTAEELSIIDKIVSNIYLSVSTDIRGKPKSCGFIK